MTISLEEIFDLSTRFHRLVGIEKGDAAAQAEFFQHPDPMIFVEHASDLTLQANHETHRGMYINTHHQVLPDSAAFVLP